MRLFSRCLILIFTCLPVTGAVAQSLADSTVQQLTKQLATGDVTARMAALDHLLQVPDARLFLPVKALLADDNPLLRAKAVGTLAHVGGVKATPLIVPLLRDEFQTVRAAALTALGDTGDPQAVPLLLAAMRDAKSELRLQAITASGALLAELGENQEAVAQLLPELLTLGRDTEQKVSQTASQSLQITTSSGRPAGIAVQRAAVALLKDNTQYGFPMTWAQSLLQNKGTPQVIPDFLELMRTQAPDDLDRLIIKIMRLCMHTKDSALLDPLRALAADATSPLHERALLLLGELRDPQAITQLITLLPAPECQRRIEIMELLLRLRDTRPLPALCVLATHADAAVREHSIAALHWAGDEKALQALLALAGDQAVNVRQKTAGALADFDDPAALDALLKLSGDESPFVRQSALKALVGKDGPRVIACAADALQTTDRIVRQAAIDILGASADTRAIALLLPLLQDTDKGIRNKAATALSRLGDERGVAALTAQFAAKESAEGQYCAEQTIRSPKMVEALAARIQALLEDKQNQNMMPGNAVDALGGMHTAEDHAPRGAAGRCEIGEPVGDHLSRLRDYRCPAAAGAAAVAA